MQKLNNNGYGIILAVGIVAILLIIMGAIFPFSTDQKTGLVLIGVSMLLFLVAGAIFTGSWQIGIAVGVIALIMFSFGVRSFLAVPSQPTALILPMINQLLLL
jgi:hypothetical protein